MRKIYVMCLIVMLTGPAVLAQRASIRHVKGIRAVDAGYGVSQFGSLYHAGYVMYFSNRLYGKAQGFYESTKNNEYNATIKSIGADVYASYNFVTIKEIVYFNGNLGVTVSSDRPASDALTLGSKFKYGALAGVDSEIFLSDRWAVILTFNEKFLSKNTQQFQTPDGAKTVSVYGQWRWFAQVGIRFNFN